MLYHAKPVKQMIQDHSETIVLYTFGSLVDEEDRESYLTAYAYELEEYADRIAYAFDEVIINRQFEWTVEKIQWLLEYEMIGLTCEPHAHHQSEDMRALALQLHAWYFNVLSELHRLGH